MLQPFPPPHACPDCFRRAPACQCHKDDTTPWTPPAQPQSPFSLQRPAVRPPPNCPHASLKRAGVAWDGWVLPKGFEGRHLMPGRTLFLTVDGQIFDVPRIQVAHYRRPKNR